MRADSPSASPAPPRPEGRVGEVFVWESSYVSHLTHERSGGERVITKVVGEQCYYLVDGQAQLDPTTAYTSEVRRQGILVGHVDLSDLVLTYTPLVP